MISLIAALTKNRVIGNENRLLWNIPEDMQRFRKLTSGNVVVMGRKTFESIGKPLKDRINIVVSRTLHPRDGITIALNVDEAITKAAAYDKEIFIIGGGEIYTQTIARADRMYLSIINDEYEGDTYFPEYDENEWSIIQEETFPSHRFILYERRQTA